MNANSFLFFLTETPDLTIQPCENQQLRNLQCLSVDLNQIKEALSIQKKLSKEQRDLP